MAVQNNIICVSFEANAACGSAVCIKGNHNLLYQFLGQFLVEIKIIRAELNDCLFHYLHIISPYFKMLNEHFT